jgi:hypothetical protein
MGDDVAVSLDLSNYELLWPTSLFVSEGERILRSMSSWQDWGAPRFPDRDPIGLS